MTAFRELAQHQEASLSTETIQIGKLANEAASRATFADYQSRKSENTLRRHKADLGLFVQFLDGISVPTNDLFANTIAWGAITWGLVAAFQKWMLAQGYAISTVNARVSTIKTYTKMAFKAGVVDAGEYALIMAIEGYSRTEGRRIDDLREVSRVGMKKADPVTITPSQAGSLKMHPDTPAGRRDAVLMCLLIDHGLRVGELASLELKDFNGRKGTFRFYRPKVDITQTHQLTPDTWDALRSYKKKLRRREGKLLSGIHKSGKYARTMSTRAINKRVGYLGNKLDIPNLSPHDLRHYAATNDARNGKSIKWLMEKYGWSSPAMAIRYIGDSQVIETI